MKRFQVNEPVLQKNLNFAKSRKYEKVALITNPKIKMGNIPLNSVLNT